MNNAPLSVPDSVDSFVPRRLNAPQRVLLVALGLGGSAHALLLDGPLGVGVLVFVLSLLGALLSLGRRENVRPVWGSFVFLVLPLVFFAVMIVVRASVLLTLLNSWACLALFALVAHFYQADRLGRATLGALLGVPWGVWGKALTSAAPLIRAAGAQADLSKTSRCFAPLSRGLLLSLPIVGVFVYLLMSADAVFARAVDNALAWLFPSDWSARAWRLVVALLVAWLSAGALAHALTRSAAPSAPPSRTPAGPLGFAEAAIVLTLVNVVFAVFVVVQFAYLFGGQTRVLALPGLSFADYARRGFFELVCVAALTLALVLGLKATTHRPNFWAAHGFNVLASLLVALTLVLLASALARMSAYEAAYGATELRLCVDVFIVWLGTTLLWLAATLWWARARFALGGFVAALAALVVLNLLNPDALIARRNLHRYRATGQIDLDYLSSLSDDVVPTLVRDMPPALLARTIWGDAHTFADELRRRKAARVQDDSWRRWPAFHFARHRAYQALTKVATP